LRSPDVWEFTLVTDAGKGYDRALFPGDAVWSITEEIKSKAVEVKPLDITAKLAPGASIEGCIYFKIPTDEAPKELWFRIGFAPQYNVKVKLG